MLVVHSSHLGTTVIVSRYLQHLVEQILRAQNNLRKEIGKNLTLISAHKFCWEAPILSIQVSLPHSNFHLGINVKKLRL
jgi:hypothetical protein